jgi:hypothetical protein
VSFGAIDLVMFLCPLVSASLWPAAVCMVVVGVPGALLLAGANTLRHHVPSPNERVVGRADTSQRCLTQRPADGR